MVSVMLGEGQDALRVLSSCTAVEGTEKEVQGDHPASACRVSPFTWFPVRGASCQPLPQAHWSRSLVQP